MQTLIPIFLVAVSIILSSPMHFRPPLFLPSSSSSVPADSFKISSLPLISSAVPSSPLDFGLPSSPSIPSGPCRYCNLCQCQQPSESDDLHRWVQQQFYSRDNNGEQRGEDTQEQNGEQTQEQKGEGSEERILRRKYEANKERFEERTGEEDKVEESQSSTDGLDRHRNDEIADTEDTEIKRRRDRLL